MIRRATTRHGTGNRNGVYYRGVTTAPQPAPKIDPANVPPNIRAGRRDPRVLHQEHHVGREG